MNSVKDSTKSGGICYFGVNYKLDKQVAEMEGIEFVPKEKEQFLEEVKQAILAIEPLDNVDEDMTEKEEQEEIVKYNKRVGD